VSLVQRLARLIEAIFPDVTPEDFKHPSHLSVEVGRTLINMWIDDESVEDGARKQGFTAHDFLVYSRPDLEKILRAKFNKSIGQDLWPYEDVMSASKLWCLRDDDVENTAEQISKCSPNSTVEDVKSSIIETMKTLRGHEAKITDIVEKGWTKVRQKVQNAMFRVRSHIFEKQVIAVPSL